MTRPVLAAAMLVVLAPSAAAQTIRPLVLEHLREGRGRFEVVNDSDRPLNVVLEPRGFTVGEDGQMRDAPMPPGVRLAFSATSFRLPPRQSRFVFYEANADRLPAWFVVYANLTGYPAREFSGMNVQLELPHIVYLLPPDRWREGDIQVVDVDFQRDEGRLSLVVENRGSCFGRVAGLKVHSGSGEVEVPGFPLFPGGRRRIQLLWSGRTEPEIVAINARSFSFEHKLHLNRR